MNRINYYKNLWMGLILSYLVYGCGNNEQMRFERLLPEETGIEFNNVIFENDSFNVLTYLYLYNGAGVAAGDVNNDGLTDLFFSGNAVSNRLYLNRGDWQFEDITQHAELIDSSWCTGVSMVDINSDGLLDIYVCVVSPDPKEPAPNLLYINQGVNDKGKPTFSEQAKEYGIADEGYSTHGAFFDYDLDGDLDLYVLTNSVEEVIRSSPRRVGQVNDGSEESTDHLYRNNGDLTFTDISREAGITIEGWGLGIGISDINQDGWPDVYVANDFLTNDLLYINNQDGTFTNKIESYLRHQSHNGMGTDLADINNDGWVDIMVLDMMPEDNLRQKTMFTAPNNDKFRLNLELGYQPQYVRNTLQLNNGNGTFSEIGQLAGVHKTDWSWTPLLIDVDNDSNRDILITNGYHRDVTDLDYINYRNNASMFGTDEAKVAKLYQAVKDLQGVKKHNYVYQNKGDLTFKDQSQQWQLDEPSYSNGAAYADLDQDGDLDLVMNNINDPAFVYRNMLMESGIANSNYIRIKLEGPKGNLQGLGTKVWISYSDSLGKSIRQYHDHSLYRGYKSTVEPIIHIGLGAIDQVDSLGVVWVDGSKQLLTDVKSNQLLTLLYKDAGQMEVEIKKEHNSQKLFEKVAVDELGLAYLHQEAYYDDFKQNRLKIHTYAQGGPYMVRGDIDGNGWDDIVVGGGNGYTGRGFRQTQAGSFESFPLDTTHKNQEDMGLALFDADNDEDLDLYVVSGGSEVTQHNAYYQDRLYLNDGAGNFTYDSEALPVIHASGSCVAANDFDQDGDQDVFVGGRVNVEQYPYPAQSYILRNEGGEFVDATMTLAPNLQELGMVTSAVWIDYDNDGWDDLIVAGEWMPIHIFRNEQGKLVNRTEEAGLTDYAGWWNTLASADFDQDGDIDLMGGNLGLNSRFKASADEPVCMYAKDYDQNGTIDPVICYYIQGENYPTHALDQMISQMSGFKKRFMYYADYGSATYERAFTHNERADAYILKSQHFATSYIENKGDGTFQIHELPIEAQFAPVYGISVADYNHDGNLDALLIGNSFAPDTHIGRYDASIGYLLAGDGKGGFHTTPYAQSGFSVAGDSKSILHVQTSDHSSLIITAANQDTLTLHMWNSP